MNASSLPLVVAPGYRWATLTGRLCVLKTSSELMTWWNRQSWRKSNPAILMVQSAQDRMADNASSCLGRA
jgi:hypothetical protein